MTPPPASVLGWTPGPPPLEVGRYECWCRDRVTTRRCVEIDWRGNRLLLDDGRGPEIEGKEHMARWLQQVTAHIPLPPSPEPET
jgi:hypothetical protein